jgi:hypothetical protein
MPASVRIIRILNDTYTLETEIEAEDTKLLMEELRKTDWGRRISTLLEQMLPKTEETFTIQQAKNKFIEEYDDFIKSGKIARVDMGEDPEEDNKEVLIVWINRPVELPREFCKFEIKQRQTPNYTEEQRNPTDGSDVY